MYKPSLLNRGGVGGQLVMYKKKPNHLIKHFDFLCIDGICIALIMWISYYIRHNTFSFRGNIYGSIMTYMLMSHIVIALFNESYKNILRRGIWRELVSVVKHTSLMLISVIFILFVVKQGDQYSRTVLIMQWLISVPVLFAFRQLRKYDLKKENKNVTKRNMVIICSRKRAAEIIEKLSKNAYERIEIDGIILCEKKTSRKHINGVPIVAVGLEEGIKYLQRKWVDEVFIQLPLKEEGSLEWLQEQCETMGIITQIGRAHV